MPCLGIRSQASESGFSQQFLAAASSLQQAQQQGLETPTPTRTLYPKHVTKAQEVFVDGFQKALLKLQADRQNPGGAAGTSQQTPQQRCSPPTFQYLLSLLTPTFGLTPQFLQPHFLQPHTPTQQLTTPINVLPLSITAATEVSNSSVTSTTTPTFTSPTSHRAARKEDVKTPQAVKRKSTASTPLSEHVDVPAIGESSPEDDVVEVTANTPPAISSDSSNASGTTQDSDATTAKKEKRAETPPGSPIIHKPKPISGTENTTIEVLGQITKLDPNNSQGYMEFLQQQGTSNFNMAQFGMQNCANSNASNNNNMQFDSNSGFGARHQSPQQHQMVPQQHLGLPQVKQEIMNSFQNLSNSPQMRGCGMASTSAAHMFGGSHPNSLDLDDQERRKLERKRARNRMAASKCRQRKMERIQELEIQVQLERQRNAALQNDVEHLKRTIFELNNQLTMHKQAGCSVNVGSTPFKVNNGMN
ncbi:bZIP transcription factor domain-containing protein [Ditylenchus destructor]|uniref:BZIP transcription factor domain-containing protein n=1 Tax=Ditylenchus destructor TaxID=166010 RepID=A0AAD4QUW6_9BILA|nr:bZIP transcription factor domain-containing protein [Ditylenchus destructor]